MIKIIIHADYMERKILLEFEQKGTLLKDTVLPVARTHSIPC